MTYAKWIGRMECNPVGLDLLMVLLGMIYLNLNVALFANLYQTPNAPDRTGFQAHALISVILLSLSMIWFTVIGYTDEVSDQHFEGIPIPTVWLFILLANSMSMIVGAPIVFTKSLAHKNELGDEVALHGAILFFAILFLFCELAIFYVSRSTFSCCCAKPVRTKRTYKAGSNRSNSATRGARWDGSHNTYGARDPPVVKSSKTTEEILAGAHAQAIAEVREREREKSKGALTAVIRPPSGLGSSSQEQVTSTESITLAPLSRKSTMLRPTLRRNPTGSLNEPEPTRSRRGSTASTRPRSSNPVQKLTQFEPSGRLRTSASVKSKKVTESPPVRGRSVTSAPAPAKPTQSQAGPFMAAGALPPEAAPPTTVALISGTSSAQPSETLKASSSGKASPTPSAYSTAHEET